MKQRFFVLIMVSAVSAWAGEELPGAGRTAVLPPVVNEKYEYYEIKGCSEKDLQCDLTQKSIRCSDGKKYDSVTNWKLKWDYGYRRTAEGCFPDSFQVTVDIIIRLPQWSSTKEAPQQLVEKWKCYMQNLIEHEKGHRDRAVEAAAALTHAVKELAPATSCNRLDRDVQELSRLQMQKLIESQKEYDNITGHGHSQGVSFP